jgi:hypothetical protein
MTLSAAGKTRRKPQAGERETRKKVALQAPAGELRICKQIG